MTEKNELDLSGANRNMWLVKVPKYISQRWEKADKSGLIGSLRIGQKMGKPEISFNMNPQLAKHKESADDQELPVEHTFQVLSATDRVLSVYSESAETSDSAAESISSSRSTDKLELAVEGKVIQRMECRPIGGDNYMKMKRLQIAKAQKPVRLTKQLNSHVVRTFKPVRDHEMNIKYNKRKKEDGKKARMDADKVKDLLFNAFERHQYYSFKDLVGVTQQPSPYLKEILKEIAIYNMRAPHKHMWELKPEYRHYQEDKDKPGTS